MPKEYKTLFGSADIRSIEQELLDIVKLKLQQKYGNAPDKRIAERVKEEWFEIERSGLAADIATLYEVVTWLKENRHPYWIRACAGSSFILYLFEITFGNPLPAHTLCTECKTVKWYDRYKDGFDIPQDYICDNDGSTLIPDGHNIPWQTFFGYGEHIPVIAIDLTQDVYEHLHSVLEKHWIAKMNPESPFKCLTRGEQACIDVSQLSFEFGLNRNEISTSFFEKNCSADDYEILVYGWRNYISYEPSDENDYFINHEPCSVADFIGLIGLLHSVGAWDEITEMMVTEMGYSYSDLICFRDDVFSYLTEHDFLEKESWKGMESVRKGRGLPFFNQEMVAARDKWVLARLEQVHYLFPKADVVENLMFRLKASTINCGSIPD